MTDDNPEYLTNVPIFTIRDGNSWHDQTAFVAALEVAEKIGYKISDQKYVSVDEINNCEEALGFPHINVMLQDLSVTEIRQWYTFINVLRKARVYENFIISFLPYPDQQAPAPKQFDLNRFVKIQYSTYYIDRIEAQRIIEEVLAHRRIRIPVKVYLQQLERWYRSEMAEAKEKGIKPARKNLTDKQLNFFMYKN